MYLNSPRWLKRLGLTFLAAGVLAAGALASIAALILPTHTPGVRYSAVTQKTLFKTVCRVGWTKTIRPPGPTRML